MRNFHKWICKYLHTCTKHFMNAPQVSAVLLSVNSFLRSSPPCGGICICFKDLLEMSLFKWPEFFRPYLSTVQDSVIKWINKYMLWSLRKSQNHSKSGQKTIITTSSYSTDYNMLYPFQKKFIFQNLHFELIKPWILLKHGLDKLERG